MTDFRPMRRKRQLLSEEESIHVLHQSTSGVLCVLGDDGYPYGVPISYVYHEGKLYFHSALQGHKVDAVTNGDKASFTVISMDDVKPEKFTTYFRSVICFGRVHIITDEAEKMAALRLLAERYNPDDEAELQLEISKGFSRMLMIQFDIEHMTGKQSIELMKKE
jgi:nitroimidazol reductase NimA-like FMN-containing flavoprotein (pyridoxamine 5'-phosphate oxidase superfamily)